MMNRTKASAAEFGMGKPTDEKSAKKIVGKPNNDATASVDKGQQPLICNAEKNSSGILDPLYVDFIQSRSFSTMATLAIKRILDIVGSVLGLIVLSPLFLVVIILIKFDSPGAVFFKQGRLGRYGKEYSIYKFRTMCQNAEHMSAGLYSFAGDSRITKIGNWLRTTSVDELPQLINVLMGTMSLVGPRPPVTYELGDFKTLNRRYKRRFRVKPGMTGLAQVAGRNCNTWDQKVNLDNQYIDQLLAKGCLIDFSILLKTARYVFQHTGIVEIKLDESLDEAAAVEAAEKETIRKAHMLEDEDALFP